MQKIAYRLAEYKITENDHGDLWWETHIGLGSLKIGKCFINGDILFIKPSDSTGPGFLKGEFLDHLNKLPKWEKTKYYCASYKIYKCQSVSRKPLFEGIKSQLQKADTIEHISYKLHRYEIIEKNNGQLFWKSHGGLRNFKKGRCHIKGNILLLEPGETELSNRMKKDFLRKLNRLSGWEKTKYFCASYTIHYSGTGAICRSLGEDKAVNTARPENVVVSKKTFGVAQNIKPTNLSRIIAKDEITSFLNFFKILVMLILRLLFSCSQIIYKAIRVFIDKWTRFRGQS